MNQSTIETQPVQNSFLENRESVAIPEPIDVSEISIPQENITSKAGQVEDVDVKPPAEVGSIVTPTTPKPSAGFPIEATTSIGSKIVKEKMTGNLENL